MLFGKISYAQRTRCALPSQRVMKSEQVSANRWLWDVKVFVIGGIDHELMGWLRAAHELCN